MSAAQRVQQHPLYIQAQTRLAYHVGQLDKELNKYPALTHLEKRTQVPKPYIVIGGIALLVILHLVNSLAAPVSNLVGFVIPAFLSFRAIESPSPNDDVQWLTYWIIFAFFNFVESSALRVVLYYFSWYFPVKTVFLLWLQLPAFRGAQTTYATVIKPVLANVQSGRVVVPPSTNTEAHE
ncbi:hypothetical protein AX14_008240 [Amanita brunnescens Koide BX004]|nr:hypothetical protein AX14_008240 [Amanita brunnescens Koide BX004]